MSPVIITAKILMQQLWALKLDWDAAIPQELYNQWMHFRQGLLTLNSIKIPRHVISGKIAREKQLHVFCDASEQAYGCAVYIRSTLQDGTVLVRLLCAKSRVAPTKTTTIPRLELCAAKLAAELLQRIKTDLKWQETSFCWTDSEIVLAWVNSTSGIYNNFVANRIASIQNATIPEQWNHVPSKENPADLVSRGVPPEKLQNCHLWFYGPLFLHAPSSSWPKKPENLSTDLEKKKAKTALSSTTTKESILDNLNHRNSFSLLQRVLAYVLRFINNCRTKRTAQRQTGYLKSEEMEKALSAIIREVQDRGFPEELKSLRKTKEVDIKSSIRSLSPFLDENGIIRVGGRLEKAKISYDSKHQMLLPYPNEITKMIFTYLHYTNAHIGAQGLLAITRQRFWPIKGKTTARSVVQNCIKCCRMKPQLITQLMGNLPTDRVQPARPFVNAGVDFCGPFQTHYNIRGKKPVKSYVAIFCCFATKAVHIEVVTNLTTEAFIGALKRFISRRGFCKNLYCDNATNFVGARNQLKELEDIIFKDNGKEQIGRFCSEKRIDFHFIPPRSPHFGGLWEAAVKSAKNLFYKSVNAASMTYEELETLMIEIEAILNSRPITPLSADPNDLIALTPGHFLVGEPLTSIVDPHANPQKGNLLYRWKMVNQIKTEFWQRWSREYLCQLQQRYKWNKKQENIRPGMMVIIKEDNTPVLEWPLGRIVETITGKDGIVRVADIKTGKGIVRRAISNLAPLPIEPSESLENHNNKEQPPVSSNTATKHKQTNSDEEEPSKRRRRSSTPPFWTTLLTTCLLLPTMGHTEVTITPFQVHPGLYFENLGNTQLVTKEWKIVCYFDMSSYWKEFNVISNSVQQIQQICNDISNNKGCTDTLTQFNTVLNEIQNGNQLLMPTPQGRLKRALINIVGNAANVLFGILDNTYAEKMAQTISKIEDNQDHLLDLIKEQTSILDSTSNIVSKIHTTAEQQQLQFNQTIEDLKAVHEELEEQQLQELMNTYSSSLILSIIDYQRIQSSLLDVMIDTHHGKINPILITPMQLQGQLALIKENLPNNVRLPDTENNLLELYKLLTIQGKIVNEYAIFQVKVPLISSTYFQMMAVIPVPVFTKDSFISIEPSTQYLKIDLYRESYYPLDKSELKACTLIRQSIYMCKQHHPMYKVGSKVSACEIAVLLQKSLRPDCKLSVTSDAPRWTQLNDPNNWIYITQQMIDLNILCNNTVSQISIIGSGRLHVSEDCTVKDDSITIQGQGFFKSTIQTAIVQSRNFTDLIVPTTKLTIKAISIENVTHHIEEIQRKINQLKDKEVLNRREMSHIHHYTVGYSSLLIIIEILCYLAWSNYQRRTTPTPPPRTSGKFELQPQDS